MYFTATILIVFLSIILGMVAFYKNSKSATHKLLLALTLIVSLWSIFNYFSVQTKIPEEVIIWLRPIMMVTGAMFPVIYLLAKAFPSHSLGLSKLQFLGIISETIFIDILAASPLVFQRVEIVEGSVNPMPGIAMPLFAIHVIGYLILTIFTLRQKYRIFRGKQKIQLKYLILGLVLTFVLATITNFLCVIIFNYTSLVAIGPLFSFILIAFVTYAIVKHRFLDIGVVIAKTVTYSLLVTLLGIMYAVGFSILSLFITQTNSNIQELLISTSLSLLMVLSFQPILHFIEKKSDSFFNKGKYNTRELLGKLGNIMSSTFQLSSLLDKIISELNSQMRVTFSSIILFKDNEINWQSHKGKDFPEDIKSEEIFRLIETIKISTKEKIAIFDEMSESTEKELLRKMNISVVVPLIEEDKLMGAILLGEKSSGDLYSVDDINTLIIIRPQISVAINNALSYEEIKKFNETLQSEVDKATTNLKTANTQLHELDKLKDEFVSLASHELRTPMTAIRGSLSTILEGYAGDISPMSREFLTAAYNENDRLLRLVNNLLNISRIEAGRFTFTITKIIIGDVINEVITNLERAAKEKNLYLKYEHDGVIPAIEADGDKVREVLINIIGNAIKFTHKGGITVKCWVENNTVITSVTDTGSGIAKDDKELLFKKFSQVQGNYSKQSGGTGLGLYISKIIIEGLKGSIWLESIIGVGSSFYFSLPIAK
jgi:signal transduction histidine kinase